MSIIGDIIKDMRKNRPDMVWTNGGDHVTGWDPNKIKNLSNTGTEPGLCGKDKVWEFDYEYDTTAGYSRHHKVYQPEQGEDFREQVEAAKNEKA